MIIAQMVGRNESERYLEEVLDRLSKQVDLIIFTDDCSTDNTKEIAANYAEVFQTPEPLFTSHEGKLRAFAWAQLDRFANVGDWVVAIDCDEKLYHVNDKPIKEVLDSSPYDVVNVRFYHMWNETQYRVDKLWTPNNSSRIFRYVENGGFANKELACGSEPTYVLNWLRSSNYWVNSGLVMQHLGYIRDEDKYAKYERYSQIDGGKFHQGDHIKSIIDKDPVLINWGTFGNE